MRSEDGPLRVSPDPATAALAATLREVLHGYDERLREAEQRIAVLGDRSDATTSGEWATAGALTTERQERVAADSELRRDLKAEVLRTTRWAGGLSALLAALVVVTGLIKVVDWMRGIG